MRTFFYMVFIFVAVFFVTWVMLFFLQRPTRQTNINPVVTRQWNLRSIDTMKYSRDFARAKLNDPSFDGVIDKQMADIAGTHANYVAIGTPYDEEFRPMLARWVSAARKYKLKVWFRGNFSGWEGWFDYPKIDGTNHIINIQQFILSNKDLFADGDIFTSCTECENGKNFTLDNINSILEYKAFLLEEYKQSRKSFKQIGKAVITNYYPMNYDVAMKVMDADMTANMGGVVVIDHYVKIPDVLAQDIRVLAKKTGGKIVLGEFGAPIPDIHGRMTQDEQNKWLHEVLTGISSIPELIGVNYWVNKGGSTALWNDDGTAKAAVKTISDFYKGF